ncbi:DUF423 domain-containing protein [Paenibacillus puerhi]|uniref:DUF423 domain-containing protein n=1 Tax=Paenibacillus puerhi TaxID=2692622 RepID=UPI00135AF44B|nr:DUF423 domain-containing protein [Paenibacillus puerhi]
MNRTFVVWGSILGFLSVALGAFGAHALKDVLSAARLANFQTGVQYQMMHALGLIGVGLASIGLGQRRALAWAGWSMVIGIIVFSGSLYALSMLDMTMLGAITPIGGVAFLIGWLSLAIAAWK